MVDARMESQFHAGEGKAEEHHEPSLSTCEGSQGPGLGPPPEPTHRLAAGGSAPGMSDGLEIQ